MSEALSLTATNLDVFWEAELYRLKGRARRSLKSDQRPEKSKIKRQKAKGQKLPTPRAPDSYTPKPKPKRVFSRPSRLPVSKGRSRWNSAP